MSSSITILKRTFADAKPYWPSIGLIFVLNFLASPISLLKPLALKILIDNGFSGNAVPSYISFFFPEDFDFTFLAVVWISVLLVILVAIFENLYNLTIWIVNAQTGEKLVRSFRMRLFSHIQRLSLAYHDKKGSSDSIYKIQYDTSSIRTFIIGNLSPLLSSFITLVGMITIIFIINWRFAFIVCFLILPISFLIRYSSIRLKKDWKKVMESESNAMAVVHEVLGSLRVVKAFGQEEWESNRFMAKSDIAMKGQMSIAWTSAIFYFLIGMTFASVTAGFIYWGAIYVNQGQMTLGELTMVISYLAQVYAPIDKISKSLNGVQSSITSMERVYNLLDEKEEVKEAINPVAIVKAKGMLEFQRVIFAYNESENILENISFKIMPGDRVGIMGSTGAGKSSLINLITRFYDPVSGNILLDNLNIKDYKLDDYRNQFSLVLQEPVLFSTTISENIAYGRKNATEKEIIEAAKSANAHEFITRCSSGYETLVGERGMQLSGGERQRIALARAFIKDAPVLILDEPTSSLDIKTELQVIEAIERLMKGRTTFMITHRLDTLSNCNIIIHLEKGKLLEVIKDNHADALTKKKINFLSTT
ncbi:ABC transporter ATP-binding protein [Cognataquiflexum rubidum]|uniref:ABC transporter ATP-binding protein n=1 Tax=Cognataquiflexum rubidum TaxID=2922273 RepID=UPI001F1457FC|nr:ABC transporter ATP-binding protein [Cognataquiflexum rubidum]MCH6235732.1 ABC transporter ATP-binding protein/permease [Cognataquiflexum rubidum]